MTVSVCPVATVAAPVETVWALLAAPAAWDRWWDGRTERIAPPGPAQAGQRVDARSKDRLLGWAPRITAEVEAVDAARHQVRLLTRFPLGLAVRNQISCAPLPGARCRVQFG